MASTSAARMRRLRARRRGEPDLTAPQPCAQQCGRMVRSKRTAPDCSICWRTSPAGREANRDRMARTRNELRQSVTTAAMATPLGS